MHIITKKRLQEFWEKHPDSEESLRFWYQIAKRADWSNLVNTRNDFSHADLAGICTIFNIGGNKYRLITKISYRTKKIYIRFILTHAEYDKGIYKNDCEYR
jgi:mRNA interferase HigB